MKMLEDTIARIWRRRSKTRKTLQEAVRSEFCPFCGARSNSEKNITRPIRDFTLNLVCGCLLLAIAIPVAWISEQWLEHQSQQLVNRMLWREPATSRDF